MQTFLFAEEKLNAVEKQEQQDADRTQDGNKYQSYQDRICR